MSANCQEKTTVGLLYRYYDVIVGLFVAILLISNLASSAKIVVLGPFIYDGGTLLFPLSYIFGDILTEVYGYDRARRTIWIGFVSAFLLAVTVALVGVLPGESDWSARVGQKAYDSVLSTTPRIVLASLIAYLAGSFSNAYLLAQMKVLTQGRWLWSRTIGSTVVGQGVDTILFVMIAFAFAEGFSAALIWNIIVSSYVFKVGVEVLFTPVTYALTGYLKRVEGVDAFDAQTDFNPFSIRRVS
ncbi:MAG: queuosine precursor transporter [Chloroflexaceae bacterium]|nr:queuosine precursor transporter [Chloroflexaceae bacterium]